MRRLWLSSAIALGLVLAACDRDAAGPSATVTVRIQDSPFVDAMAVLVTFSGVSVRRSGAAEFTPIPFVPASDTRTCDLKKLQGATDVLGAGALPEGHYTQLRLTVTAATLYFDNPSSGTACAAAIDAPAGASASVEVPEGEVEVNHEFDVSSAGAITITLDFEGDESIHPTGDGGFTLTPVVSVVSVE